MAIKCLRLEIIKPYNEWDEDNPTTWNELGGILRDLRYQSSRIANLIIQKCYEWEMFKLEYKKAHGVYPDAREHRDKSYLYPIVRREFPQTATNILNQVRQQAERVWKTHRNDVLSLRKSIPSFRLNFPICVFNRGWSVAKTDNSYIISVGLLPKEFPKIRYRFIVKAGEKSKKVILERIIDGTYKKGALQIISDRKNKWYCLIPYEFQNVATQPVADRIMGIDLGIANAVYWAFNDSPERGKIEGFEIEAFRKRVQARRKSIQQQGKYCGDGRIGHGRKRRLKPIEVMEEREAHFRATTNHRYARHVVEAAVKYRCTVIQMEELSGIQENDAYLKTWPYFDLQQKIKDKATEKGITVVKVNPRYTSQRCSRCGHIDRDNRPTRDVFLCGNCGYGGLYHCFSCGTEQREGGNCVRCGEKTKVMTVPADYNAARNIATPDIETIIQQSIQDQSNFQGDSAS